MASPLLLLTSSRRLLLVSQWPCFLLLSLDRLSTRTCSGCRGGALPRAVLVERSPRAEASKSGSAQHRSLLADLPPVRVELDLCSCPHGREPLLTEMVAIARSAPPSSPLLFFLCAPASQSLATSHFPYSSSTPQDAFLQARPPCAPLRRRLCVRPSLPRSLCLRLPRPH